MKKIITLLVIISFGLTSVKAQEDADSLYIYYNGSIVLQQAIAMIDSINFTKIGTSTPEIGQIYDFDGNAYDTVRIADQTWTVQNWRSTHYSNSMPIPQFMDSAQWRDDGNLGIGGYVEWEFGEDDSLIAIHGLYYNYAAVIDPNGLAPQGWRVPTEFDWLQLKENLDSIYGDQVAGGAAIREVGTEHWNVEVDPTNNVTGFTVIPSGYRGSKWYFRRDQALFVTTTEFVDNSTRYRGWIMHDWGDGHLSVTDFSKIVHGSVRLIKDESFGK